MNRYKQTNRNVRLGTRSTSCGVPKGSRACRLGDHLSASEALSLAPRPCAFPGSAWAGTFSAARQDGGRYFTMQLPFGQQVGSEGQVHCPCVIIPIRPLQ